MYIIRAKAFHLFQVHFRPLLTKESDTCYSFASVDHMGGSVALKEIPFTPHPLNGRIED